MKLRPLLIALSLAANLALLFAVVQRSPRWSDFFSLGSSNSSTVAPAGKTAAAEAAKADTLTPETWANLTTGDIKSVAERLRAEGFPASLQRAIIGALVAEQFADRHHALAEMIRAQPWWAMMFNSASGGKIMTARQQLQRDEKDAIDALLGPDAGTTSYAHARQQRQFGDLAPAKMSELDRINSDYNELISDVRNSTQGILLKDDRDKIAYLEKEKRDDITKLLTPEELFDYDLRSSPTANSLRTQLAAFNPTEDEFRAIFKAQQAFDAQYGGGSVELISPEQRRARAGAQQQLNDQVQTLLTPDRFADYKLKTDSAYLSANAIVTRLELPATATTDIVTIQKDILKRADTVRTDRSLSADERTSQLTALGSEAIVRLTPVLGDTGLAAYKQTGGYWINMLQRTPPPPTATPKQ
jgi:hypothetical protein